MSRTLRMKPENTVEATQEADAAVLEQNDQPGEAITLSFEAPKGEGPFYVQRPGGRKVTRKEATQTDSGSTQYVMNDYYYSAFYGEFETLEDVEQFLRTKRSRGTVDWTNGVNVVSAAGARKIKSREEGADIVG